MGSQRFSAVDRLRPLLESIPLLSGLPAEARERLCQAAVMRRFKRGVVVVERGGPADALYAVASGRLKVVSPRHEGQDTTLFILGPGDVFGEVAMFQADGRTARVTSLEETLLMVIERATFERLLALYPELSQRLLRLMAARLRNTMDHFDQLTSLEVGPRLARKLLLLAEHFGARTQDGIGLTLKLSQRDLAELVDSTRQTVNRLLRGWTQRGWIRSEQGQLVLLDPEALRAAGQG